MNSYASNQSIEQPRFWIQRWIKTFWIEPLCLANFSKAQKIEKGRANYCETVFISKANLKTEVTQMGNLVSFSCCPKMEASHLRVLIVLTPTRCLLTFFWCHNHVTALKLQKFMQRILSYTGILRCSFATEILHKACKESLYRNLTTEMQRILTQEFYIRNVKNPYMGIL